MKYTEDLIGSNLIYALTTGLYSGNLDCLREYIQNSWDAKAENVSIKLENGGVNIVIEDDGEGMDEDSLRKALGVGLYMKDINFNEGQYGIGIWSGVAVCNRIVIITKKKDMNKKLRIEIYAKEIRDTSIKNYQLLKFLSSYTSEIENIEVEDNEIKNSFTIIRLEEIIYRDIFTKESIMEYISQKLPVPISSKFKYSNEISQEIDNVIFRTINVTVDNEKVYRLQNVTNKILNPIVSFIKIDNENIAKIWYSVSSDGNAIKGTRGFVIKHNGFTIKDWKSLKGLIGGRFNERYIGEIHLVPSKLKPTTNRADIQPSDLTEKLYDNIRKFLISLQRVNSYQTVNIFSPKAKIEKMKSKSISFEEKVKILKEIESKNFIENVSSLENNPLISPLIKQLKPLEENVKKEFENLKKEIEEERKSIPSSTPEFKKLVSSLFIDKKLKSITDTLMQKKYIDDLTINPFNALKEKIEKKVGKKFNSFTKACDEIGESLTLFKGAKNEKENNKEVKELFKSANKIFRDYFEHAKGTPQTEWFDNAQDKDKLKMAILSFIALIDQMIELMVVISPSGSS